MFIHFQYNTASLLCCSIEVFLIVCCKWSFCTPISVTHNIKRFHVKICHRGFPGGQNLTIRLIWIPFWESHLKGGPNLCGHREKSNIGFFSQKISLYMWGSQEKKLGPKVNFKFFTVDPDTLCKRVLRLFPFVRFVIYGPFLGRKILFWCSHPKVKSNIDSFWMISGFFGLPEFFWKFQRVSKFYFIL